MARPIKWRQIECLPAVESFVPERPDEKGFGENVLKLEELEAIRLKDMEGLEQGECASKMQVSRPTFQRILLAAREKIADSLINGKAIRIEGGNFTLNICPVKCLDCGHEWTESFENIAGSKTGDYACPKCNSKHLVCGRGRRGKFCRGNCNRCGRKG